MKKQGILTVISGFSGAGKGTVVKQLLETYPDEYCLSISATTRKPRENEEHGVHYFFISKEEFEALFQDDCDGKNESPVIDNIQENQLND